MKGIVFLPVIIASLLTWRILPAFSQVTSDHTTNTTVNQTNNHFDIFNGIPRGNNLFHSFKEFSIPKGGSATFNNSTDVLNIINRVTGGNISNIDGLIKANGNANLFLINPAGIVFGENARLDIGGSFLGSTASSILFEDGFNYSAINLQQTPLLTVSVPLGLQMGTSPGSIEVNNIGHELSEKGFQPLKRGNIPVGLSVNADKTLALVGGNILMMGGIISDEDGRVELGAVTSPDVVYLNSNELGWKVDYSNVSQFGDIKLQQQSLVETSDIGAITLHGQNILFQDGSILLIENRSNQPAIGIDIKATGTVEFTGTTSDKSLRSGLISDAFKSGRGGDISISATKIVGRDNGGDIRAFTFTDADSGNIRLSAKDIFWSEGERFSAIAEIRNLGTGNGGILELNTERLFMQSSAFVSTVSNNGLGSAGSIIINATESVELAPNINQSTLISSSAVGANGDAGNITINTKTLTLAGGALISSSTFGSGDAGNIVINARERLSIKGSGQNGLTFLDEPTTIRTAGVLLPEAFLETFGLPREVTGNAGTIEINTAALEVESGALVTVRHDSLGNAGNLEINADSAILNHRGNITASTVSGEGGNINLNLQNSLILRNNSLIDTESFSKGNGGNITINSPIIIGLENSDIIANAVEGNGGNINITTQGLLGLKFREELTDESDITSSSEFGLNEQVMLEQLNLNPVASSIELPSNLKNTTIIQAGCRAFRENKFIVLGRGLPQSPSDLFNGNKILVEVINLINQGKISSNTSFQNSSARVNPQNTIPPSQNPSARVNPQKNTIIEATGFIRNSKGEVELVAAGNKLFIPEEIPDCRGIVSNNT